MKLEKGDYLEVNYKDTIRQLIPNYEKIWGKFIGHDGKGSMINIEVLTSEEKVNREKFAEHFYTCMESIICMNFIAENCNAINLKNPNEYIEVLNCFMSFQAHTDRIIDNTAKFLEFYFEKNRIKELVSPLDEYYQQRNLVFHNKKLPVRIIDNLVLIAPPMGKEHNLKKWHSDISWSGFHEDDFEFICDYFTSTVEGISKIYNDIVGNLLNPILKKVKSYNIDIDEIRQSLTSIGAQGYKRSYEPKGNQGPISSSMID